MSPNDFVNQFKAKLDGMNAGQKVGLLTAVGLTIAVVIVSLMWTMEPRYQYLFTDLSESDAALIVQNLKEDRIAYKLVKGGTALMIPEGQVYETRLSLAAQGLPKGGVGEGFALFDETKFSTSEFVQKINYQRALQNELANTVMSLEEVDYARVHITMPKESVFIEDEKPAKASIVIRTKGGSRIAAPQVQGIVYLVAKSVRGLNPENISIVDIRGRVLYEGKDEGNAVAFASNHLEIKHAIEQSLENRAQDLLEKIVGPGAAVVKVSADVNMDMVKSVNDTYDPEIQVVRSEELSNQFTPGAGVPGGLSGTPSNLPTGRGGAVALAPGGGAGGSSVVRNYEIGRNQTERIQSPGDITRLTVSVVVDGSYRTDDSGKRVFAARPDEELKGIEDAVRHAVGFSADRDDSISVSCMPFAQDDTDYMALSEKEKRRELITSLVKPAVFFLIVLLLLLLVIRPLLRWLPRSIKVIAEESAEHKALAGDERELLERQEVPKIEAVAKSDEMKLAVQGKRKLIEGISRDDIGTATAVVKAWLQEKA